jgi:RHS repeat-associated protein
MGMPGRSYKAASGYRYGFNGKENDNEVKGDGNQQDYGMRIYDPRLGRFLSVDPLRKKYPELTPYQFASNTPIQAIDLDGAERLDVTSYNANSRTAAIQIVKNVFINSNNIATQLSALSNTTFQSIFSAGNTTLYVSSMPQNGSQLTFISKKEYEKGAGFKLDVTYNVTLQTTTTPNTVDLTDNVNSLVQNGTSANFTNPNTFARATTNNTNSVSINPNYAGFNPPPGWDPSLVPNYEELIAHEVGFHNMQRQLHGLDAQGNVFYPTNRTLESNQPGQIRPNSNNTQSILNGALINNNLNDPNLLLMPSIRPVTERQQIRAFAPAAPTAPTGQAPTTINNLTPRG